MIRYRKASPKGETQSGTGPPTHTQTVEIPRKSPSAKCFKTLPKLKHKLSCVLPQAHWLHATIDLELAKQSKKSGNLVAKQGRKATTSLSVNPRKKTAHSFLTTPGNLLSFQNSKPNVTLRNQSSSLKHSPKNSREEEGGYRYEATLATAHRHQAESRHKIHSTTVVGR